MATNYTCRFCRSLSVDPVRSCPACGAPVDVNAVVGDGGWEELPPIPDMARIQFGRSLLQIEGELVPVADFALHDHEKVWFNHHVLLWKDPAVQLERLSMGGAVKRMFAGLPLILCSAEGPGRVALSFDHSGELVAVPLDINESILVHEHHFLAGSSSVAYDYQRSPVWYRTRNGDETETHYPVGMYIDEFTALDEAGVVLIHAKGNVFRRELGVGEEVLVKGTALLYVEPSVTMAPHFEQIRLNSGRLFTQGWTRLAWVRVLGPGRVAIQSVHGHHHLTSGRIVGSPDFTTERSWL